MKNKIYTFNVDADLDEKLKNFQTQLREHEEIISSVVAGNKLIVTTKESTKSRKIKNLLLEELEQNKPSS